MCISVEIEMRRHTLDGVDVLSQFRTSHFAVELGQFEISGFIFKILISNSSSIPDLILTSGEAYRSVARYVNGVSYS